MKHPVVAVSTTSFLGVLLGCLAFSAKAQYNSVWQKLQVLESGITFNLAFRGKDYTKPYRMKFIEDGVRSVYKFQASGCVTDVKVGSERYTPVYDSSADLIDVVRTKRRNLAEYEDIEADNFDGEALFGNRRLFACEDCVDTWDALCDEGAPCVCDMLNFKSNLSRVAEKSIKTICEKFGSGPCSDFGGPETCAGQCVSEEIPTPAPTPTIDGERIQVVASTTHYSSN